MLKFWDILKCELKIIGEYTDQLVRVQTKIGQIRITGKHLQVDSYTNDDMKITGKIQNIEYQT